MMRYLLFFFAGNVVTFLSIQISPWFSLLAVLAGIMAAIVEDKYNPRTWRDE